MKKLVFIIAIKNHYNILSKIGIILFLLLLGFLVVNYFDDQEVFIESQESKTTNGLPVYNKIKWISKKDKDIWMMNQSHHGSTVDKSKWDRIAIVINKKSTPKTVRFYQLEPGPLLWTGNEKKSAL